MDQVRNKLVIFTILLSLPTISCGGGGDEEGDSGVIASLVEDAVYPEAFSYLSGVRELPDGQLLAADPLSQVLLRVDLDSGTADTLGRVGGGPEEYEQPDHVFALPGDSTLLVDLGKSYLTVVGPDGAFRGGLPMVATGEDGGLSLLIPEAVDGLGRIYSQGGGMSRGGVEDSISISRFDRENREAEVVARLWRTKPEVTGRSGNAVMMSLPRMLPSDTWAVGEDGRIAVIRANGYSVEWHLPNGETISGPETPFESIPIGYDDKVADLERSRSGGLAVSISRNSSGGTQMQMSRGGMGGGGDGPSVEEEEWGETFPPFQEDGTMVSPANDVWVLRWLPADRPPQMDVFGPDGMFKGSVMIPQGRQLIGFGEGPGGSEVAYLVRTDEVDLKWLERYRVVWND